MNNDIEITERLAGLFDEIEQLKSERDAAQAACAEILDITDCGWAIIANASGGDWTKEAKDWQEAAACFRERHHNTLTTDFGKSYFHVRELEQTISVLKSTIVWAKETQSPEVESAIRERLEPEVWRLMALKEKE